ncbi:MAG: PKD domain-containing protein, partial [Bacteroidetes bacterium]|nr:PKD domain-containing protein [Bacteroidota bacterium]
AFAYSSGGSHTVTLTERDDSGMEITSTQTIFVNTNAGLVDLGNDTTICYGAPIILDAGGNGTQYRWSNGATTRTLSVREPGVYGVLVTAANGCTGWDSISVFTTFPLVAAFDDDITSHCLPVTVNFKDQTQTVCGTAPLNSWKWYFGDGDSSTAQDPVHIYQKAGRFTVKMVVRNTYNVYTTVSRDIVITTVGPDPVVLQGATICLGHFVTFDAGNQGARFAWTPALLMTNDTIRNPSAAPGVSTLFKVAVTKCGVTVTDSAMVYVDSVSRPVIQYDGALLMAQPGVTYQWYKDGVAIAGATSRSYKPEVAGYYQVEISNSKGCYGRSDSFFALPEGVSIPGSKIKVKLSPNPVTGDWVHILFSKIPPQAMEVNIYDAFGRKVWGGACNGVVNTIDCSRFYKGMYYVEVITKGQKVTLPMQVL